MLVYQRVISRTPGLFYWLIIIGQTRQFCKLCEEVTWTTTLPTSFQPVMATTSKAFNLLRGGRDPLPRYRRLIPSINGLKLCLVGGLEHVLWLSIQFGMSSQLTFTPWFFRGVGLKTTKQWSFLFHGAPPRTVNWSSLLSHYCDPPSSCVPGKILKPWPFPAVKNNRRNGFYQPQILIQ